MKWSSITAVIMLLALIFIVFGAYSALVLLPESPEPILKNNYRIVFFHVPSAITSFVAFTLTLIAAIQYLRRRELKWDVIAVSSAKVGFFMITAALISGSIWARIAWGTFWNWDPRETTVLILWLVYAAYFVLRASIEETEERAKASSILAIFAYVTIPLSYFSTFIYFSLHPSTGEVSIGLGIGTTLGIMMTAFFLLYVAYMLLGIKLSNLELTLLEEAGRGEER
jgi:heme exporter protein C